MVVLSPCGLRSTLLEPLHCTQATGSRTGQFHSFDKLVYCMQFHKPLTRVSCNNTDSPGTNRYMLSRISSLFIHLLLGSMQADVKHVIELDNFEDVSNGKSTYMYVDTVDIDNGWNYLR